MAKATIRLARATDDWETIRSAIYAAELVSFDIFDTLVRRDVWEPGDVFEVVARRAEARGIILGHDWRRLRAGAERRALESTRREEVTLDEVYRQLVPAIGSENLDQVKKLEVDAEVDCCRAVQPMLRAYQYAISAGKHVVLTSDMYLPRNAIERILGKAGISSYEKLYLSSETMRTKRSGTAYDLVRADYEKCASLLHIGDHPRSDYLNARSHGFAALLVPGRESRLSYWPRPKSGTALEGRIVAALLCAGHSANEDLPDIIGREVLGPMLLGYCLWLHEQVRECGAERVAFLAREGKLYKRAYEILYPNDKIPLTYLKVSRRALAVPMLAHSESWSDTLRRLHPFLRNDRVSIVAKLCGCSSGELEDACGACGVRPEDSAREIGSERGRRLFELIVEPRRPSYLEQGGLISAYLDQEGIAGNVVLSDIGYGGTMQRLLSSYLGEKCELHGRYLGVFDSETHDQESPMNRKGYLFDKDFGAWANDIRRFTNSVFEFLMLNPDGSVSEYARDERGVHAVLGRTEYGAEATSLSDRIQSAALDFIEDMRVHPFFDCVHELDANAIVASYYNCFGHPSKRVISMLGPVRYEDGSVDGVVADRERYLFHPSRLKSDFDRHHSKAIFLASLFGGSIPWIRLLSIANGLGVKSTYRKAYIEGSRDGGKSKL